MSMWKKIKQFWLNCVEEQKRVNLERAKKYPKIFGMQERIEDNSSFNRRSNSTIVQDLNSTTGLPIVGKIGSHGNGVDCGGIRDNSHEINPATGLPMMGSIDYGGNPYGFSYYNNDHHSYDYHRDDYHHN